ncbi:MAG: hypothetical protein FWG77_10465, partial [Treponema sp.]|nr:hypothetical protein [Treponema sp.]
RTLKFNHTAGTAAQRSQRVFREGQTLYPRRERRVAVTAVLIKTQYVCLIANCTILMYSN